MACHAAVRPKRALFHRLGDEPIHLLLFGGIGRPFFEAANHALYLLRRNTGGDVDRDPAAHHCVEIAGKGFPVGFDAVAFAMLGAVLFQDRAFQRRHRLAFADDVQRHALAHFALGVAVGDQRLIAVRMHVDIARRDDITLRRDRALSRFGIDLADARDLAVFDRHVAVKPRVARAVDHSAAVDDDIEFSHSSPHIAVYGRLYHRTCEYNKIIGAIHNVLNDETSPVAIC